MQQLNADRRAVAPEASSLMKRVFGILFPAGPAVNSLLATAYISGPPSASLSLPLSTFECSRWLILGRRLRTRTGAAGH